MYLVPQVPSSLLLPLNHIVLSAEVLAHVRLVERHDGARVQLAAVLRAFAATPKPSGTSDMEKITTPWFAGVFSVMRPRPDLSKWLP